MKVYELINTNESIGRVDIYNNASTYVATLKKKDFKSKEYIDLLIKEVERWYIASITVEKTTIAIYIS